MAVLNMKDYQTVFSLEEAGAIPIGMCANTLAVCQRAGMGEKTDG
jgi:hypothetical protein